MDLNQVTVPSIDVAKAITFYKKLGLHLIVHTHDAYARFECPKGDSTFSIHQVDELPTGAGVVVYFEVDDIEQHYKLLSAKGLRFDTAPTDQKWLWKEASLKDLDGNRIIMFEAGDNRKNPPWRLPPGDS